MAMSITKEDIARAKTVDLPEVVKELGYTVKRIGNYHTIKEMDSIRIYGNRTWYRWSDGTGGSQIDFLMTFADMDFVRAVSFLLNRTGKPVKEHMEPERKQPFILPEKAENNNRIFAYLTKKRRISQETVNQFIGRGLIYEEKEHHNVVFVGKDKHGTPRFGSKRGTYDKGDRVFKCDVAGSDKSYGFHYEAPGSNSVRVFEGAIDLMSFYDATRLTSDHLLALGMTGDNPLSRYVEDHSEIRTIFLCLDNDEPGRRAAETIMDKYKAQGYKVKNLGSPKGYKDYNEWLVATRSRESLSVFHRESFRQSR